MKSPTREMGKAQGEGIAQKNINQRKCQYTITNSKFAGAILMRINILPTHLTFSIVRKQEWLL